MRRNSVIVSAVTVVIAAGCAADKDGTSPSRGLVVVRAVDAAARNAGKGQICHRDDSGVFRLMNVSASAVDAHRAHGDGAPGELVPGNTARKFDERCALVDATSCPCRFSLAGLQELYTLYGDLGTSYHFFSTNVVTQFATRDQPSDRVANRFVILQAPGPDWPQFFGCVTRVYEPGFAILSNEERLVTPAQAQVCVDDLAALARSLGVNIP